MPRDSRKHTPGPWTTNSFRGTATFETRTGATVSLPVCEVYGGTESVALVCETNQASNARLIALAPEMAAALGELLAYAESRGDRAMFLAMQKAERILAQLYPKEADNGL